jgi:hypothetical protein
MDAIAASCRRTAGAALWAAGLMGGGPMGGGPMGGAGSMMGGGGGFLRSAAATAAGVAGGALLFQGISSLFGNQAHAGDYSSAGLDPGGAGGGDYSSYDPGNQDFSSNQDWSGGGDWSSDNDPC